MLEVVRYNLLIALEAIVQNRLRALLTSLGIIFGVASVIAMLAIGKGAEQQILEQMKLLGTNNIIIQPVVEQEEGQIKEDESKPTNKRYTPGLTLEDIEHLQDVLPTIKNSTPEIIGDVLFVRNGIKKTGKLIGVSAQYFDISATEIESGVVFSDVNQEQSMSVCVIGKGIKTKFFAGVDPIGKRIKCGSLWFTVVGVLQERGGGNSSMRHLGIRDFDMDIYIPATTFLLRFKNRGSLTQRDIKAANSRENGQSNENEVKKSPNYHQIDRMILHVADSRYISSTADVASRMLQRRHNEVVDFEVVIPELLLKQEQRTKRIFNIVLSSIASISLLVGGIGIMNIMFASVVERYKEIGTRMAIGARKLDIKLQFLTEALVISLSGGISGILFGIGFSYIIESATDIKTIVSISSIVISFGVSISVGLIFGIFPAIKAAEQEPADVLRYE